MKLFDTCVRPLLFRLDPETAHDLSIHALASGMVRPRNPAPDERLHVRAAGLDFPNPLGLAAGYDKNAEVADALTRLGFGHVEVGSVTPRPQIGNPRPRLFRLNGDGAVINRFGFNNDGHRSVLARLEARNHRPGIVGVNIGANKDSADFIADYVAGIQAFWHVASYFTVNISSPNTPGLRDLHDDSRLAEFLERVLDARAAQSAATSRYRPVFLKISPDLGMHDVEMIARRAAASSLDGMVISNTTISRAGLPASPLRDEPGGLSGKPLFEASTALLARIRRLMGPDFVLIGLGGVCDGETALAKLEAGADLVQLYTGLVFEGPGLAAKILRDMSRRLDKEHKTQISDIRGRKMEYWEAKPILGEIS